MAILRFSDFLNERQTVKVPKEKRRAAGVVVLYDNRILLIHPTNSSWRKPTCGIPKGGIEEGEEEIDAAVRELMEETGITVTHDMLEKTPETVYFYDKNGKPDGMLTYYVCNLKSLTEIGLKEGVLKLPASNLQKKEVDWAKFVGADEAYSIMNPSQLIILDRHLRLK